MPNDTIQTLTFTKMKNSEAIFTESYYGITNISETVTIDEIAYNVTKEFTITLGTVATAANLSAAGYNGYSATYHSRNALLEGQSYKIILREDGTIDKYVIFQKITSEDGLTTNYYKVNLQNPPVYSNSLSTVYKNGVETNNYTIDKDNTDPTVFNIVYTSTAIVSPHSQYSNKLADFLANVTIEYKSYMPGDEFTPLVYTNISSYFTIAVIGASSFQYTISPDAPKGFYRITPKTNVVHTLPEVEILSSTGTSVVIANEENITKTGSEYKFNYPCQTMEIELKVNDDSYLENFQLEVQAIAATIECMDVGHLTHNENLMNYIDLEDGKIYYYQDAQNSIVTRSNSFKIVAYIKDEINTTNMIYTAPAGSMMYIYNELTEEYEEIMPGDLTFTGIYTSTPGVEIIQTKKFKIVAENWEDTTYYEISVSNTKENKTLDVEFSTDVTTQVAITNIISEQGSIGVSINLMNNQKIHKSQTAMYKTALDPKNYTILGLGTYTIILHAPENYEYTIDFEEVGETTIELPNNPNGKGKRLKIENKDPKSCKLIITIQQKTAKPWGTNKFWRFGN